MSIPSTMMEELNDRLRVEKAWPIKKAVASRETLSNGFTASHYHLPRPVLDADGWPVQEGGKMKVRFARDAYGKHIVEGEEFSYIDYLGDPVWRVYRFYPTKGRFLPVDEFPTQGEAKAYAEQIRAEIEAEIAQFQQVIDADPARYQRWLAHPSNENIRLLDDEIENRRQYAAYVTAVQAGTREELTEAEAVMGDEMFVTIN